jgi:hypothetical protein
MIEIFKTNIHRSKDAHQILRKLHTEFPDIRANFDLDDCDHILRVDSGFDSVPVPTIIELIQHCGFHAQVLPDTTLTMPFLEELSAFSRGLTFD